VKLSVSLRDDDVEFLDDYVQRSGAGTRSAAIQRAIRLLRASDLESEYAQAIDEWLASGEAESWEPSTGDGLTA
jgi:Arc/MetJ-type ribon-helix-helix transcriptional regulator